VPSLNPSLPQPQYFHKICDDEAKAEKSCWSQILGGQCTVIRADWGEVGVELAETGRRRQGKPHWDGNRRWNQDSSRLSKVKTPWLQQRWVDILETSAPLGLLWRRVR